MPKIFTDQHAYAPKPCIERADRIAPGKEATFIKQTISRQVNLMMDMHDCSAGKVGGSNVKIKMSQTTSDLSVSFFEMPVALKFKNATQEKTVIVDNKVNDEIFMINISA